MVVIGGGWAGWGAAKALCEAGVAVTLLDGQPDPTGSTPLTTASGQPFEAGTRGFWKDYPNINALTAELNLGEVFTPFTQRVLVARGLGGHRPGVWRFAPIAEPLGQMFATLNNFRACRLPM